MYKLDFHADDYGLSLNTSREILHLINHGKLDSISLMSNMDCYEEALKLWREELIPGKKPDCSVHLNFMEGRCCADKSRLDLLVDQRGLFRISWGSLVKYHYHPRLRKQAKAQLKLEIEAQIEKVVSDYSLLSNGGLRVDSHQHTHMIPLVWEALTEVLREKEYPIEYIRIAREDILPYLQATDLYRTYLPINIIKVLVLNWYSRKAQRRLRRLKLPSMFLCGVVFSGKMDAQRVRRLLPGLIQRAKKRQLPLEVLFHPGTLLQEEMGEEFNHPGANSFYLSGNRSLEHQSAMELEKPL